MGELRSSAKDFGGVRLPAPQLARGVRRRGVGKPFDPSVGEDAALERAEDS